MLKIKIKKQNITEHVKSLTEDNAPVVNGGTGTGATGAGTSATPTGTGATGTGATGTGNVTSTGTGTTGTGTGATPTGTGATGTGSEGAEQNKTQNSEQAQTNTNAVNFTEVTKKIDVFISNVLNSIKSSCTSQNIAKYVNELNTLKENSPVSVLINELLQAIDALSGINITENATLEIINQALTSFGNVLTKLNNLATATSQQAQANSGNSETKA